MLEKADKDEYAEESVEVVTMLKGVTPETHVKTGDVITLNDSQAKTIANTTIEKVTKAENGTNGGTVTVSADSSTEIYVYYKRNKFNLTVTAGENTKNATGTGSYKWGQTVSISAEYANEAGFDYSGFAWSTSDVTILENPSATSTTVTMPAQDVTVVASQTRTPHILTVKMYANGAVKDKNGNTVNELLYTYELPYDGIVEYNWPKDYVPPYGFQLVRDGYTGDGKYHIGSGNSNKTIWQDLVKETTAIPVVAESLGVLEQLNAGNVEIGLYAGWKPTAYTITYNLDGGSVNGTNAGTYTIESDIITLKNPTKVGYTFTG